jgi:hypothetical protein
MPTWYCKRPITLGNPFSVQPYYLQVVSDQGTGWGVGWTNARKNATAFTSRKDALVWLKRVRSRGANVVLVRTVPRFLSNLQLAEELVRRLNRLCSDDDVRQDLGELIENRINCSAATARHPAIETTLLLLQGSDRRDAPIASYGQVGFLGFLNGLLRVDTRSLTSKVVALFDRHGQLIELEVQNGTGE